MIDRHSSSASARRRTSPALAALLALSLLSLTYVAACRERAPVLQDLAGFEDLKARFNKDAGKPRIVLLLSPT